MKITRDREGGKKISTQKQYLKKVLQCFNILEKSKQVSTSLASHMKLSTSLSLSSDKERECMSRVPYANVVGSLIYVMVCKRPKISHVVRVVIMYMHDPGKLHRQTVKWILRYLLKTVDVGLVFERHDTCNQYTISYVVSEYSGDLNKWRSTTGYVFTLVGASLS